MVTWGQRPTPPPRSLPRPAHRRPADPAVASPQRARTGASARRGRGTPDRPSPQQEAPISPDRSTEKANSWLYCEEYLPEDEVLLRARDRAAELGTVPVMPGTGALLALLAGSLPARAAVEIGTGTGVAALWMLRGMPADGVLTTIDVDVEHQRAAKETFAEAGIRPTRTRCISGRALDVLPRLTDGAYDLVLVDGDRAEYPAYVEQGLRLLRPGGVLAVEGVLWRDRVPDPARRDETTIVLREVTRRLRDDDRVRPALLPTGDGLLLAVRG